MVPRRQRDVFHARLFGQRHNLLCIEVLRRKVIEQLSVLFLGNMMQVHRPFPLR